MIENGNALEQFLDIFNIYISIVTIEELDHLKTNKDPELSFKARRAIRKLKSLGDIINYDLNRIPDSSFSKWGDNIYNPNDDIIVTCAKNNNAYLATYDFNLVVKANALCVETIEICSNGECYKGYLKVVLSDEQLSDFYSNLSYNHFDCMINQYVSIYDSHESLVDVRKWNGENFVEVFNKKMSTEFFGRDVKSKDEIQRMAFDSIMSNPITAISGPPGSGKSYISLVSAVKLLESNKYDRITILFNPIKTRGVSDLGYYPGTQTEKAMQNSIGNMLSSKLGDESNVLDWIENGKIRLISMADCRGMEISDRDILYITEAQNTTSDIMKLCLTRVVDGCKVIIEGDYNTQVDSVIFQNNNGLKSVVDKFRGYSIFGYVELNKIYRGEIASLADTL